MTVPPRGAAVRGDDYQYAIGWLHAADALRDAGVASVSVEDAGGGHFDDVVIRRIDTQPDLYLQVKSSNSGNVDIDETWLTTSATVRGRSPLQHFYDTWRAVAVTGRPFILRLISNRGFDSTHALLGPLRDNYSSTIRVAELREKGTSTKPGRAANAWATHLSIDLQELYQFLAAVEWHQGGPEATWRENAKRAMLLGGLRDDDEAVQSGIGIIREWVKTGAGPQTPDHIRAAVANAHLLATAGEVVFAVNAIDRPAFADRPNIRLDWVDHFTGNDAQERYQAADPRDWRGTFTDDLRRARTSLEAYRVRRARIVGAMRQATYFAVGRTLPDVRRWVLLVQQRDQLWSTDVPPDETVATAVLADETIGTGGDIAVAIALANDITGAVGTYCRNELPDVGRLLVLGPDLTPGGTTVRSNAWLTAWVRAARNQTREAANHARRIHLFLSGPASAALMLGHQWNTLPTPTTVYEFDRPARTYFSTFEFL